MLTCDTYLQPSSLSEAFAAIAHHHGGYKCVAGATDLLPWAREGRAGDVHIPALIDLSAIPELNTITASAGKIWIGAATKFQRFIDQPNLARALPAMPDAALWFADQQLRESATIGGNIINASPAADGLPPLLINAAQVELARASGTSISRRRMPLHEFITGPGRCAVAADEILLGVECEDLSLYSGAFEKVGHRRSLVISVACVAAAVKMDARAERFEDVRLSVGGVGPVAQRMHEIEDALRGSLVSPQTLGKILPLADHTVQSRSRQDYRKKIVRAFIARALSRAMARAGVSAELCARCEEVCHD